MLAAGIPIVTFPSAQTVIRTTSQAYTEMEFYNLTAADLSSYVALAVKLGTDQAFARQVRADIRAAAAVLFERRDSVDEWVRLLQVL